MRPRRGTSSPTACAARCSSGRATCWRRRSSAEARRYDAIFCRNLLIYFDRPTQERAVRALERLLTPDGVRVRRAVRNGRPAEPRLRPASRRRSRSRFERRAPCLRSGRPRDRSVPPTPHRLAARDGSGRADRLPRPRSPPPLSRAKTDAPAETVVTLDEAAELANRGRFEEAIERCEQHLTRSGPSAEVFHLMGLVRDASGNPAEAERCYRKALYLDPHHDEVLVHLALLLEKAGKTSEAQLLRETHAPAAAGKPSEAMHPHV